MAFTFAFGAEIVIMIDVSQFIFVFEALFMDQVRAHSAFEHIIINVKSVSLFLTQDAFSISFEVHFMILYTLSF